MNVLYFVIFFLSVLSGIYGIQSKPHIVFIVADDLGWNDVSWNNPDIISPNLENLARNGVILNQSYVQPVCTPSRAAFMTGYFPYRTGRQNSYIHILQPTGVSLKFPFISERLKDLGYSTHIVGKWHLGYCNWSYTPTHRGFDSFFGYYIGSEDYYKHSSQPYDGDFIGHNRDSHTGLDFRNNTNPADEYSSVYSTYVFSKAVKEVLMRSDPKKPLFLYLPFQSVHAPLEVPKRYEDLYSHIVDRNRRVLSGMVTAMDDAVGHVVADLKRYGFWNNLVIAFTTDNGGQTVAGGNNWPLRGNKGTLWEGGTRGPAFVYATEQQKRGYVNNNLFHAVDWHPTFNYLAGGPPIPDIDGMNQWSTLDTGSPGQRTEFVYNIFDATPLTAAIRVGRYKLIVGNPGKPDGWIPVPGQDEKSTRTNTSVILFDILADPLEKINLAEKMPEVVNKLERRLQELKLKMVPADEPPLDTHGDPEFWGGIYSPGWCEAR